MRVPAVTVFVLAAAYSANLSAQDRGLSVFPGRDAKWQACYEESRLMHRTRNLSLDAFRQDIKAARRSHMEECMTKVEASRD
jgi:hypothetical protein